MTTIIFAEDANEKAKDQEVNDDEFDKEFQNASKVENRKDLNKEHPHMEETKNREIEMIDKNEDKRVKRNSNYERKDKRKSKKKSCGCTIV